MAEGLSESDGVTINDPDSDYSFQYFRNMECWKRPVRSTTADMPWIPSKKFHSFVIRQFKYHGERAFIDLENPLLVEDSNEIRKPDRLRKASRKEALPQRTLKVVTEGVTELSAKTDESQAESEENFLDEHGNLIENRVDPGVTDSNSSQDETSDSRGEATVTRQSQDESSKKRRKRNKKKKGKIGSFHKPKGVSNASLAQFRDLDAGTETSKPAHGGGFVLKASEPRHSFLSQREQELYLALMLKFEGPDQVTNLTPSESKDLNIYHNLGDLVRQEQVEFQKFSRNVFENWASNSGPVLKPDVKRYIDEYYEWRLKRVSLHNPRFYELFKGVPGSALRLVPQIHEQTSKPQFQMRPDRLLVEMGEIPKLWWPNPRIIPWRKPHLPKLSTHYEKMSFKVPTNPHASLPKNSVDGQKLPEKVPVSLDPNADVIAKSFLPSIVISVSALKTIFANFGPLYEHEWEIPITIRCYNKGENGKTNVVFIDKPLPPKLMTAEEKRAWYHKIATKAFLLHPWTHGPDTSEQAARSDLVSSDSMAVPDFFADSQDHSADLETFGVGSDLSQLDGNDSDDEADALVIADDVGHNSSDSERQRDTSKERLVKIQQVSSPNRPMTRARNLKTDDAASRSVPTSGSLEGKTTSTTGQQGPLGGEMSSRMERRECDTVKTEHEEKKLTQRRRAGLAMLEDDDTLTDQRETSVSTQGKTSQKVTKKEEVRSGTSGKFIRPPGEGHARGSKEEKQNAADEGLLSSIIADQSALQGTGVGRKREKGPTGNLCPGTYESCDTRFFHDSLDSQQFLPPAEGKNVSYRLWKLWNKEHPQTSSLDIVVRSSTHGMTNPANKRGGMRGSRLVFTTSCKVENQPDFGVEMVSITQLAKEWIATLVRPNSNLARLRVAAGDSSVIVCERSSFPKLTRSCEYRAVPDETGFLPSEQLGLLHTLFSALASKLVEPGQYLLRHDSKSGPFVLVYKALKCDEENPRLAAEKGSCQSLYDLHSSFNSIPAGRERPSSIKWSPIDVHVVTHFHKAFKRVPGLFTPKVQRRYKGNTDD